MSYRLDTKDRLGGRTGGYGGGLGARNILEL